MILKSVLNYKIKEQYGVRIWSKKYQECRIPYCRDSLKRMRKGSKEEKPNWTPWRMSKTSGTYVNIMCPSYKMNAIDSLKSTNGSNKNIWGSIQKKIQRKIVPRKSWTVTANKEWKKYSKRVLKGLSRKSQIGKKNEIDGEELLIQA